MQSSRSRSRSRSASGTRQTVVAQLPQSPADSSSLAHGTPLWAPLKTQLERMHVHSPAALSPLNPGNANPIHSSSNNNNNNNTDPAAALAPLALPAPELSLMPNQPTANSTPAPSRTSPNHHYAPTASSPNGVPANVHAALAQFASQPHSTPGPELLTMLQSLVPTETQHQMQAQQHITSQHVHSQPQSQSQSPAPTSAGANNGQLASLVPLIASIMAPHNGANQAQAQAAGARVLQALSDFLTVQASTHGAAHSAPTTTTQAQQNTDASQQHAFNDWLNPSLPEPDAARAFNLIMGDGTPHSPWGPQPQQPTSAYTSSVFVPPSTARPQPLHAQHPANNTSAFSTPYAFSTGTQSSTDALSLPHTPAAGMPPSNPEMDLFVPLVSPALGMRGGHSDSAAPDALQPFTEWLNKQGQAPSNPKAATQTQAQAQAQAQAGPTPTTASAPGSAQTGPVRGSGRRGASVTRSRTRPSPLIKPQGGRSRRASREDPTASPAAALGGPVLSAATLEALRQRPSLGSSVPSPQRHRTSASLMGPGMQYPDVAGALSAPATPATLLPTSAAMPPPNSIPPAAAAATPVAEGPDVWNQALNSLWFDPSPTHPPATTQASSQLQQQQQHPQPPQSNNNGGPSGGGTAPPTRTGQADDDGMCWIHTFDDTPSPIQLEGPGSSTSGKSATSNASSATSAMPGPQSQGGKPYADARPSGSPASRINQDAIPLTPASLMGLDALRTSAGPTSNEKNRAPSLPTIPQAPEPEPSTTILARPASQNLSCSESRRTSSFRGSSTVPASPAFNALISSPAFLSRGESVDHSSNGTARPNNSDGKAPPPTPPILKAPRKGKGKSGKGTEANRITFHAAAAAAKKAAATREAAAREAAALAGGPQAADQRRTSHKAAEQKRRDSLKDSFDDLRDVLPAIILDEDAIGGSILAPDGLPEDEGPEGFTPAHLVPPEHAKQVNRGISKAAVLRHGNEYLYRVQARLARREALLVQAREENLALRALVTGLTSDVPQQGELWPRDTPTLMGIRAARTSSLAPQQEHVTALYAEAAARLTHAGKEVPLTLPASAMPEPDRAPSPEPDEMEEMQLETE